MRTDRVARFRARYQAAKYARATCALEGIRQSGLLKSVTGLYTSGQISIEQALSRVKAHHAVK